MRRIALPLSLAAVLSCGTATPTPVPEAPAPPEPTAMTEPAPVAPFDPEPLVVELVARHGADHEARLRRGIAQVAALWRTEDGDLATFVREHYVADPAQRDLTFARFEAMLEQIDGHFLELGRDLRRPTELDLGPMLPVDALVATWDPGAHATDDLFASKVAFVALLNFPLSTLSERTAKAPHMSRRDWAEDRLAGRFARRVPAAVRQKIADVGARADLYIAGYNLWMHHVVDGGARRFVSGKKLISHWNLRDELKARYADGAEGLAAQRTIVKVMERIVEQSIPQAVIGRSSFDWDPFTNQVTPAPAAAIEKDGDGPPLADLAAREPDTRYRHLLDQFHAHRAVDPFTPSTPNAIQRAYEVGRELSEARVVALFEAVLGSPLVPEVAAVIRQRLGRALEPQDLWYDGFKARSSIPEAELDALTKARWPTPAAFEKDLPKTLERIGFAGDKAKWLAEHIRVDPSRGAGHAMPAGRRGDFPRLRTRVGPDGMDYKGFNIAVHELGHNVEQVFSLYAVDHTLLAGVPNTAFTEALAFVFQARDLAVLGREDKPDPRAEAERVLADFWATWEIAGVALVDLAVWHWLYEHPDATPAELRDATVAAARAIWRRHYAPVLGGDTPLLAIYSHMIAYPLYLADYPLGHLIAFQIEEQVERARARGRTLGQEIERMATIGSVMPDAWMQLATGAPVSAEPLLDATRRALATLAR